MNYYDFKNTEQTCKHCGWRGLGRETGLYESFGTGFEYSCPKCHEKIGYQDYPTIREVETDPRADPIDRKALEVARKHIDDGTADPE